MISIDPFSRDGYDNNCIWVGGCIGFFGLLFGGLIVHSTWQANLILWSKSFKFKKF
ncbi:hypothetical protein SALINJAH_206 [Bacillus phage SalinJah]|uniref:Uncharacterized protein n=1 Tax=Bacillus phage SalinJah TaxID=1837830 RepID=A0A173GC33_9CAUD|nr:hypothetical protein SALINJAH_206 [Bacillus phage SalinJah]ANH50763.1 hypothetical protein SALINJAH_206 [Bacillus phage SalinJah]